MAELPTPEDLKHLPLRLIVAYAARCARRVRPLFLSENAEHVEAVEAAVRIAERFAEGDLDPIHARIAEGAEEHASVAAAFADGGAAASVREAAYAARDAVGAAAAAGAAAVGDDADYAEAAARDADAAARAAAEAAAEGADFATHEAAAFVADAAMRDFEKLRAIASQRGEKFPQLGQPIDVTETGPLGPFWPEGPPEGVKVSHHGSATFLDDPPLARQIRESEPAPLISVYFDDCGFTDEDKLLFLSYLSEVYRDLGGIGLKVVEGKTLVPEREVVQ